jgi:CRP-like cAMP-binding protein
MRPIVRECGDRPVGRWHESRRDMLIWTPCRDCSVRDDALCGAVPLEELLKFNRHAYRKRFRPGSVIMTSGEQPDWYANIISGVVKLTMALPDGHQQIVGLLFPADATKFRAMPQSNG